MRISDWSSDVCSSDLPPIAPGRAGPCQLPVNWGDVSTGRDRSSFAPHPCLADSRSMMRAMLWPSNLTVRRLHALDGGQGKSGKLGHLVLVKSEKGARGPHLLRRDHNLDRKSTRLNSSH